MDVAEQLAQTLEGVVLALDGHQHLPGRRQAIDGNQAQRRGAVDQDEVEVVHHRSMAAAVSSPG